MFHTMKLFLLHTVYKGDLDDMMGENRDLTDPQSDSPDP